MIIELILFFRSHPAFYYSFALLAGTSIYFYGPIALVPTLSIYFCFFLYSIAIERKFEQSLLLHLSLTFLTWGFCFLKHPTPSIAETGLDGTAMIKIDKLTLKQNHFGSGYLYECTLSNFYDKSDIPIKSLNGVKCSILLSKKNDDDTERYLAHRDYFVKGTLKKTDENKFRFRPDHTKNWHPIDSTYSFAEWRYQMKKRLSETILKKYSYQKSGQLLKGLATGQFDDSWMVNEFSRFGLQHILAISGFHFAILATIFRWIFRPFLSEKRLSLILLISLSCYFHFLGFNPSIARSWVMIGLALLGELFQRKTKGLNSLGVSLFFIVFIDPIIMTHPAFQFSFLATLAILLYQPIIDQLCSLFLTERTLNEMVDSNRTEQIAYCTLMIFRKSFALAIAVNLFTVPLTLFYFKQFPLLGLIYNFFFPFLVSVAIFLMTIGLLFTWFPAVSDLLHQINQRLVDSFLHLLYDLPSTYDWNIQIENISSMGVAVYLLTLLIIGIKIRLHYKIEDGNIKYI